MHSRLHAWPHASAALLLGHPAGGYGLPEVADVDPGGACAVPGEHDPFAAIRSALRTEMTVATQSVNRAPRPSSLADVLEVVLDKGIVIDAYVRVAALGIELLTIDARIVIASVDTYLRFAEAVNRLDLQPAGQVSGLPGMIKEITGGDDGDEGAEEAPRARRRRPTKQAAAGRSNSDT